MALQSRTGSACCVHETRYNVNPFAFSNDNNDAPPPALPVPRLLPRPPCPPQKKRSELDQLRGDLEAMREKCEAFLRQATASPSVPTLSSELDVILHSMSQVYSMSSICLEK